MNAAVISLLLTAVDAGGGPVATPAAGPSALVSPVDASVTPAPGSRWYGWQTLAVDAALAGALTINIERSGARGVQGWGIVPVLGLPIGTPLVHATHGHELTGALSLLARLVVPPIVAVAAGLQSRPWSDRDAAWGYLGAMAGMAVIDAGVAWDEPRGSGDP
jgi:hypothetical protein